MRKCSFHEILNLFSSSSSRLKLQVRVVVGIRPSAVIAEEALFCDPIPIDICSQAQRDFRFRMAHYFKYKSAEDLAADAAAMGTALPISSDFSPLFESLKVGRMTVGNRFCIQPMEGCDGTLDGSPDELTYRRFRRFGAGGAKLIWGEATAIEESRE